MDRFNIAIHSDCGFVCVISRWLGHATREYRHLRSERVPIFVSSIESLFELFIEFNESGDIVEEKTMLFGIDDLVCG